MIKQLSIVFALFFGLSFTSCDVLNEIGGDFVNGGGLTSAQIGQGLKQALELGITEGANKLSAQDGYFKSAYKILLPEDVRKVTAKLSNIPGFNEIENVLLEKINRGAEDAAKKAAPIFKSAITSMSFSDAMNILMGADNAATGYLDGATRPKLYGEFNPVIVNSLNKFGAIDYWEKAVSKYNSIPFVTKMNPRLDDYVTTSALNGLFKMVEKKEKNIRKNTSQRTTDLLKQVFAKQDNK
ncbi:MAG: hypothetical protein ACI94Y_003137 [Maribacter sp.]|jgi:hypothetical protein